MDSFFPARGCVYQVVASGGSSKGFYSFKSFPQNQSGATSVVLLQGIEYNASDIIQPIVTLEDIKVLYTFGSDFGQVSIFGEILLGPAGGADGGAAYNSVVDFFKTNRISQLKKPIPLSLPGSRSLNLYLQALNIGRVDPELHVQPFAFTGIVADSDPATSGT